MLTWILNKKKIKKSLVTSKLVEQFEEILKQCCLPKPKISDSNPNQPQPSTVSEPPKDNITINPNNNAINPNNNANYSTTAIPLTSTNLQMSDSVLDVPNPNKLADTIDKDGDLAANPNKVVAI